MTILSVLGLDAPGGVAALLTLGEFGFAVWSRWPQGSK
jgi:hypothetical protein